MNETMVTLVDELEDGAEDTLEVFAAVESAGRNESFAASEHGFKAQFKLTVWAFEYDGQPYVRMDSVRYAVYRTYLLPDGRIELYLTDKIGGRRGRME